MKKNSATWKLCIGGIIAALYAALTLLLAPISYGNIQCRVSEAFTMLPLLMPESIPGLFVGCLVANIIGSGSVWDIVFGSLATLLAACGTWFLRGSKWLAAACPVVANGIIVGAVLSYVYGLPLLLTMLEVAVGEVVAVALGLFLLIPALKKTSLFS